jgi:hypothetical protein
MSTVALVGYDHETEALSVEKDIPAEQIDYAKRVAHVPADDPRVARSYALAPDAARDIAGAIDWQIDTRVCDFYLEGYAD